MKCYRQILSFFVLYTACFTALLYDAFFNEKTLATFEDLSRFTLGSYLFLVLVGFLILTVILRPLSAQQRSTTVSDEASEKNLEEDMFFAAQIHKQMYQEPITGLGNRRYFDNILSEVLSSKTISGALLLIELEGLKQYNDEHGYLMGNRFIKEIAATIKESCYDIKLNFLARIGGSSFAMIAPQSSEEEIENSAVALIHALEAMIKDSENKTEALQVHMGIASLAHISEASELMSHADLALKKAKESGPSSYAYYEENKDSPHPNLMIKNISGWEHYIHQLIGEKHVTAIYQPVVSFQDKKILSYEALLRIKHEDKPLSEAKAIVPTADRFGLTHALDQAVITQVLAKSKTQETGDSPYAINLSADTLLHEPTLDWLQQTLSSGNYRNKIIFELSDHTILKHSLAVTKLIQTLTPFGIRFGMDYYGYEFSDFDFFKTFPWLYIKIDGRYVRNLNHQDNQLFIRFLARISHKLGIQIIAKSVETEEEWDLLQSYQLDGAQGIYCNLEENK